MKFDKQLDSWVCPKCGPVDFTGWLPCWQCGGEGDFDCYEDDAINYSPGEEYETCGECRGEGGWAVCGNCAGDNPDVEW